MQTVVELPSYIAKASRLMSKEERSAVIDLVASNPDCGDVIAGTGGVRKVRIAQKGKGKSGSYRVVYYFCNDTIPVFVEPSSFIRKHLTGFARLLARHRPRRGLYDHKWAVTMPSERANPAFGAPEQPTSCVSQLARCAASRCADCLAG